MPDCADSGAPPIPPAPPAPTPEDPKQIATPQRQIEKLQGQLSAANTRVSDLTIKVQAITSERDELVETLSGLEAKDEQRIKDETLIVEKMSKGLTRDQAIAVIERQKKFDADKKTPAKPAAKK